ncbi:hypothetical protein C2G38_2028027 [Gigaspora rosea]|uniref:Histidine kinase-like ATPase n=1 Tax=Gigaspora rosea TaxID=44941 RepID=A0A397W6T0_9GLOM|nr:hypothetical protein C2G38_2028027 [Gigaspora rosea]
MESWDPTLKNAAALCLQTEFPSIIYTGPIGYKYITKFSNIESEKLEVCYRETNIVEFTQELVSDFKSSNALKHTWNGRVAISLYVDYKDKNKMIVLEVSDTGVGIPELALPNIFQRFYRVESQSSRSHEGTGIGLALVKELITFHGGDITVTSIVNKGTTFKCWFPIGCDHLPSDKIQYNNVDNQISYGRELYTNRQLYLEESSQWVKNNYLADLLKEFDVHRACDGQDAIRVLKKLNKLPDLVLSDIMMPNMNGYELLEVLRSNVKTRIIPVILLSAKAGEESKIKGLDKGADDYLIKPFSSRELITRIRANIVLSHLRRKILFQQYKQEGTKQLLLTISNKILSGLDLNETLLDIIKEIHHKLPRVEIYLDVYCDDVCKNVSVLSVEITLNNICWGWIKLYRSPNSIWLNSEIELLQQISNQISLIITYVNNLKENAENEIIIKAIEVANKAKSQILANTSHELRTPSGAIVGILSSFENTSLNTDQKDMINIMIHASDIVLSIVNDILNAAKLEARKITLIYRTFDLLELLEDTIENFGKRAGAKKIDLIVNCEIDSFPRYVKSDPDRIKFTDKGKIVLSISIQLQEVIDKDKEKPTYGQMIEDVY